jgi:antitoxin component YwqK of YwqJK toxin-antitoxin module
VRLIGCNRDKAVMEWLKYFTAQNTTYGVLVNQLPCGNHYELYPNGNPFKLLNYSNGVKNKRQLLWYPNKQLECDYYLLDDKWHKTQIDYYPTGQIKHQYNYLNGHPHGKQKKWYENTHLMYEYNIMNSMKHGTQTTWYNNGQIELIHNYEHGMQKGRQQAWKSNGTKIYDYVVGSCCQIL